MKSPIVDMWGDPITRDVLHEPQTSKIAGLRQIWAEHPSHRLTPQRLARILREAEMGNLSAQADLFTDMEEQDAHLFAEMQKRKRSLLTVNYVIQPPTNPTPLEVQDAQWLTEFLSELDGWEDLLIDMLDAIGHGFSNIEIEWENIGLEWYPSQFHFRPQSWFQLDKTDQNKIILRTDDGVGEPLQSFGWIQHRHKSRSGYVSRSGLLRTLAWPYLMRNFGTQSLAELLEIYGIPLRIGKYPSGTGQAEKNQLMRAVTELGRYAGGIIPAEMVIELTKASDASHSPFMALTDSAEKSMSKAILGGTLTTQADGKTSTNALGNIHNEVRHDLLISDGKQVATTLRSDLFWPLIVLNRRPNADRRRTPRLVFQVEQTEGTQSSQSALTKQVDNVAIAALVKQLTSPQNVIQSGIDAGVEELANSERAQDALLALLAPALQAARTSSSSEIALLTALAEAFPKMEPQLLASCLGDTRALSRLVAFATSTKDH